MYELLHTGTVATLAIGYALCAALIWFAGARALVLWALSQRMLRRAAALPATAAASPTLRVALLYCVADDFCPDALRASMRQSIAVDTYILDDSRDAANQTHIDAFAAEHLATVIRRPHRTGFKAGNLNHALSALRGRFDACVVLDSDTVLPRGFVAAASAQLQDDGTLAVVQAVPDAAGTTLFARVLGPLVNAHALANHLPRTRAGLPMFIGRGALIRAAAIHAVGGVPETVAEDLALTTRLRAAGWGIAIRPDLRFGETYPIDYAALRTQVGKAAEGAAEFLRSAALRSSALRALRHRERLDALTETALLPAGALAGLGIMLSGVLLAVAGIALPAGLMAATAVIALMPLLPTGVATWRRHGALPAAVFLAAASLVYGSVALLTLRRTARVLCGRRAVFTVTPKTATRPGASFGALRSEFACALVAAVAAIALHSPALAAGFAAPVAVAAVLLSASRPRAAASRHRTTGHRVAHRAPVARRASLPTTVR
ncbi:glycosyltransferase [Microbacterium protaetiae]|nr:glycosyltransferase [Microbacterium protaetiae]